MAISIWYREDVSEQEWADYANACEQRVSEIYEDKHRILQDDGYAFYHEQMASSKRREADLARNHGIDYEVGLVDLEGNLVEAKIVEGKYGSVWRVQVGEGVEWVNVSQAQKLERRQAFYRSKGYQLANVFYHFAEGKHGFYPIKQRGVVELQIIS